MHWLILVLLVLLYFKPHYRIFNTTNYVFYWYMFLGSSKIETFTGSISADSQKGSRK